MLSFLILVAEVAGFSLLFRRVLGLPLAIGPALYIGATILIVYFSDFLRLMKPTSILIHVAGLLSLIIWAARITLPRSIRWQTALQSIVVIAASAALVGWITLLNEHAEFHSWDEFSHWGMMIRSVYEAGTFHFAASPLYFQDYTPGLAMFAYHGLVLMGYSEGNASLIYALMTCCMLTPLLGLAFRNGVAWFLLVLVVALLGIVRYGHGLSTVLVDHMISLFFAGAITVYYTLHSRDRGRYAVVVMLGALTLVKQSLLYAYIAASICVLDLFVVRYFGRTRPVNAPVKVVAGSLTRFKRERIWMQIVALWQRSKFKSVMTLPIQTARAAKKRVFTALGISGTDLSWAFALFALPIAVNMSWRAYLASSHAELGWGSYSPAGSAPRLFRCCTTEREFEGANKFFANMFGAPVVEGSPAPLYEIVIDALRRASLSKNLLLQQGAAPAVKVLAFILIGIVASWLVHSIKCKLRVGVLLGVLTAGFVGYNAALLVAYLYDYTAYEGLSQYTFSRFENVYILAFFLLIVMVVTRVGGRLSPVRKYITLVIMTVIAFISLQPDFGSLSALSSSEGVVRVVRENTPSKILVREPIRKWAARLKRELPQDAKVYIAWPGTTGIEFWLTKFELLPRVTNLYCFSFQPSGPAAESEGCRMSVEQLRSALQGYDYLIIGKNASLVRAQYSQLFEQGPSDLVQGLYRIENMSDGFKLRYQSEFRNQCLQGAELGNITQNEGVAFAASIILGELGPDDTTKDGSRLVLCEDDHPLGEGHSNHVDIRSLGRGRYSHLPGYILFSTSDNSNPQSNGRRYRVFVKEAKS